MQFLQKTWRNFKIQPDIWLFYGFLVASVLSVRKIFVFFPIRGRFNEYSGIYLYLSDIFLFLTIVSWGISILCNNKSYLSIINAPRLPRRIKMFHMEHFDSCWGGTLLLLPFLFVLWSFISILWSNNPNLALFRSIKFLELFGLYIYLIFKIVPRGTILKRIFQIFIFFGVLESIIGIGQFILQHSIGLFWLKESFISPEVPGVAKLIINGDVFIRSYGLFPHPDILGGFLLISIILSWQYKRLFHAHPVNAKCSTWNILRLHRIEQLIIRLMPFLITIQIIALILAFCKSAIIGTALAMIYIIWTNISRLSTSSTDREKLTIRFKQMFHMEHIWHKVVLLVAILAVLALIIKPDTNSLLFKSLNERLLYQNVSRGTISAHPIIGIGNGQFVANMQKYADQTLEVWQYQPVHNIFLLIWSELGIIGLGLFTWFLWKLFHACPVGCSTWNIPTGVKHEANNILPIFKGILLGFTFIMLFDHYLWDIQQGQIMLWLVMGMVAGRQRSASIDK